MTRGVLLLQDNAPAHTSTATAAVTKCSFEVPPHPPHTTDLTLRTYLYPNLKTNLRGRHSGSKEGVIDADEYLGDQEEDFYFEGISKLEQHWKKYIEAKGVYI